MSGIEELAAAADSEARLRIALSSGDIAIWEMDIEKNEITRSPNLNRLYGFPPDARPTIAEYVARYAPGEAERVAKLNAEAAARGDTRIEHEIKHIWPDGTVKWLLVRAEAGPPAPGGGPRALGVVIDITARKQAEEGLQRSERRLRLAQQAGGITAFELDVASGDMIVTDNFWPMWGLAPRDKLNIADVQNLVLAESRPDISTAATRKEGTATAKIEFRIRRGDSGEVRWLARDAEFVRDASGAPATMYGAIRDITSTKLAEERQALLTHELQHRIKNILATVSAIASQTLRKGDLDSARDTFNARLKALSEAHSILTGTGWTGASLRSVLDASLAPHNLGPRVSVSGEDYRLTPRMALSMALAVNELATNAVKYGALSNEAGRVEVAWGPVAGGSAPDLVWTWRESGGPKVSPPQRRGFGSVLIERVLAADFGGQVEVGYMPGGVVAELKVPLANLPSRSE